MAYGKFARLYDELMADVPYSDWITFVQKQEQTFLQTSFPISILDIGCGTGTLTIMLAESGYHVIGVDLSSDMLAIAQEKAHTKRLSIPFYEQNMTSLSGLPHVDMATIFCDSLNYVLLEQDVRQTFRGVHRHLKTGGLLLFDVHSEYKMEHVFKGNTFASNDEDLPFIWHCFAGDFPLSVEHELSFFVKDGTMYHRFDEQHTQRTFAISDYKGWLEDTGFEVLDIRSETFAPVNEVSERIFFTCKKI